MPAFCTSQRFENDYWKWRRDQFEHDERYEVQGVTQSDFLTRELASVKMRHYRHAGDAVMPAFDVKEEDYASLLERTGLGSRSIRANR